MEDEERKELLQRIEANAEERLLEFKLLLKYNIASILGKLPARFESATMTIDDARFFFLRLHDVVAELKRRGIDVIKEN